MGNWPSKVLFTSTLAKRVAGTQSVPMSLQPLHPEHPEVNIVWEEDDKHEPAPLACKEISD